MATFQTQIALDHTTAQDELLVGAAQMGDARAFEQLIRRHYRSCLSKAIAMLRNVGDAEDEAQNACTQAWTHLWQYKGEGSFGGWLRSIVAHQCLVRIREGKRAHMFSIDTVTEAGRLRRLEVIDQRALPEEVVADGEVSRVLANEIRHLPPLLRDALIMRELRHLAIREVAARLGIRPGAAKSRLMRARLELGRRLLKRHGGKDGCTLLARSRRPPAACVHVYGA